MAGKNNGNGSLDLIPLGAILMFVGVFTFSPLILVGFGMVVASGVMGWKEN